MGRVLPPGIGPWVIPSSWLHERGAASPCDPPDPKRAALSQANPIPQPGVTPAPRARRGLAVVPNGPGARCRVKGPRGLAEAMKMSHTRILAAIGYWLLA